MSLPAVKLVRFWQAIESIPGQEATLVEWRSHLGREFDIAKPLLRPNGSVAESIPSDGLGASAPILQIVRHADDDIVGVSEEGDRIPLAKEQILIHQLDRHALAEAICRALKLEAVATSTHASNQENLVGTYEQRGIRNPVFLVIAVDDSAFEAAVSVIPSGRAHPRVILVPMARRISPTLRQRIENQGACVLGLSDILTIAGGQLVALQRLDETVALAFRTAAGEAPRADGVYSQREIIWRGVGHECDLTVPQMEFLKLGLADAEIDIHKLMHPKNGVVWKERYQNSKGVRDKISQFVSRLNKALLGATPALGIAFSLRRDAHVISRTDPLFADTPLTED